LSGSGGWFFLAGVNKKGVLSFLGGGGCGGGGVWGGCWLGGGGVGGGGFGVWVGGGGGGGVLWGGVGGGGGGVFGCKQQNTRAPSRLDEACSTMSVRKVEKTGSLEERIRSPFDGLGHSLVFSLPEFSTFSIFFFLFSTGLGIVWPKRGSGGTPLPMAL